MVTVILDSILIVTLPVGPPCLAELGGLKKFSVFPCCNGFGIGSWGAWLALTCEFSFLAGLAADYSLDLIDLFNFFKFYAIALCSDVLLFLDFFAL